MIINIMIILKIQSISVIRRDIILQATRNQDRHITETRPRHDRELEFFNLEASSIDIRATATLVCPKVHNIQIQIGILDLLGNPIKMFNVHHLKIETPSPKQKKQHCNINDATPSHHPRIIKTSQHHHHTSQRLHRNMSETSPTHH